MEIKALITPQKYVRAYAFLCWELPIRANSLLDLMCMHYMKKKVNYFSITFNADAGGELRHKECIEYKVTLPQLCRKKFYNSYSSAEPAIFYKLPLTYLWK